ncbi:BLUF domain-containing protein [Methylobacterium sp. 391_Methyba4]|uniref:BLUF domain-containing protein n=1 Tax=Methylobacterium sp. 391_Methyba4 TaxID=3038924 RepID=UPI0006896686|nr:MULTISPECIES: BLUF domain-containing protein [Methylobacterium]WFS08343.1 BLUF domain-containing protein [Methylobacterium sp. 391_Methyba4]
MLDVTGALVASQHWFAQILEGSGGSIDTPMTSISRDRRHRDVQILVYEDIKERQFPDWTLAYNGSAHFVDGLIEVLAVRTGATPVPYHLHRLMQGIAEFTRRLH